MNNRNPSLNVGVNDLHRILKSQGIAQEQIQIIYDQLADCQVPVTRNFIAVKTTGAYRNFTGEQLIKRTSAEVLFCNKLHKCLMDAKTLGMLVSESTYTKGHPSFGHIIKAVKNCKQIAGHYPEQNVDIMNIYIKLHLREMSNFFNIAHLNKHKSVVLAYLAGMKLHASMQGDMRVTIMIDRYHVMLRKKHSAVFHTHKYSTEHFPFFAGACINVDEYVASAPPNQTFSKRCTAWLQAQFDGMSWANRPPKSHEITGVKAIERYSTFVNKNK